MLHLHVWLLRYAMHMHAVLALCIAPAALHADFAIFAILYSVNCKKQSRHLFYTHLARFITLYEPNNENVVPAFLCGSKWDCVVEEDFDYICFYFVYL